ncbi:hypothetical protein Y045_5575 [Burkholderia pseudomallei MSHR2451]|nr:hypothetical protein Y045_5575 [Burkholderia pseudomallei MSHR2451]
MRFGRITASLELFAVELEVGRCRESFQQICEQLVSATIPITKLGVVLRPSLLWHAQVLIIVMPRVQHRLMHFATHGDTKHATTIKGEINRVECPNVLH